MRVTNTDMPAFITGLAELASAYRALLSDVWGVVHDGMRAHKAAVDALVRYRQGGGAVLLITNAPRPKAAVVDVLDRFGVSRDAYDDILTSGDATRDMLAARAGARVLHVGSARDLELYQGLPVTLADEQSCDVIACTGLVDDETETPDDYREALARWRARGVPMICANPDLVVERGGRLVWCAGALAERYRNLGGETIMVGKPHPALYETALRRLSAIAGVPLRRESVLAIGDGIETDVRGAVEQGLDVLFVTGGVHAEVLGDRDRPDLAKVHAMLASAGLGARATTVRLAWEGES